MKVRTSCSPRVVTVPTVQVVLVNGPDIQLEGPCDSIIQAQDGEDLGQEVVHDEPLSLEMVDVLDLDFQ